MGGDLAVLRGLQREPGLNPPRPHGRGLIYGGALEYDYGLNPPRPHGRGLGRFVVIPCAKLA